MSVSTSLYSVARTLSAPFSVNNMAEYGANHLNDMGKGWWYLFTLGIAKLYEIGNAESMEAKKDELKEISIAIKKELDVYANLEKFPDKIKVNCTMNSDVRTLSLEKKGDHIYISFDGNPNSEVAVVKYYNFSTLHEKLYDELYREEDSSMDSMVYIITHYPSGPNSPRDKPQ